MEIFTPSRQESPVDFEPFFSTVHLAWLIENGYLAEVLTLGHLPFQSGEDPEAIIHDLKYWGVLDDNLEITKEASHLFSGLTGFDERWWGTLILTNERQPLSVDLPEDMMGIAESISDTPKVYWMVSRVDNDLVLILRAGYNISISRYVNRTEYSDVAKAILSIINPNNEWNPARFDPIRVPTAAVSKVTKFRLSEDPELSQMVLDLVRKNLTSYHMNPKVIKNFVDFYSADNLAMTTISHSTSLTNISDKACAVSFIYNVGMVTTYESIGSDGNSWTVVEPTDTHSLAPVLKLVKESQHREFMDPV